MINRYAELKNILTKGDILKSSAEQGVRIQKRCVSLRWFIH